MPLLQYKCPHCGKEFDELVKSYADPAYCPVCGARPGAEALSSCPSLWYMCAPWYSLRPKDPRILILFGRAVKYTSGGAYPASPRLWYRSSEPSTEPSPRKRSISTHPVPSRCPSASRPRRSSGRLFPPGT